MKMKKKVLSLLTALLLVATLFATAFAADSPVSCVTDISGILTYDEWEALETRAQDISLRTNCGVYIVILDDYTNYGEGDVYDVASQIFKNADNGFGVGTDHSGILLLLSMNERNWAMFVNGENAKYAFDNYGQTALKDAFLSDFDENDWYGELFAAAYLGYRDEDNTDSLIEWLYNNCPMLKASWAFLEEIPEEDIIGEYGDLYCIVPMDESVTFTVKSVEWETLGNGTMPRYSDPLYYAEVNCPFLMYVAYGDG